MHGQVAKLLDLLRRPVQFTFSPEQNSQGNGIGHCIKLWEDLFRGRFSESVIYVEKCSGLSHSPTPTLQVLLGHWFLLNISLLIAALGKAVDAQGGIERFGSKITSAKLNGFYLFNEGEEGGLRYKVLPSDESVDSYIRLLEKGLTSTVASKVLTENFEFFTGKFRQMNKADLCFVYSRLSEVTFFEICLDEDFSRQQILQSLASVGRELDRLMISPQLAD